MKSLIGVIFLVASVSCANILQIYPWPYHSHYKFHQDLLNIFLERGHHVTMISEVRFNSHENFTQIHLNESTQLVDNMKPLEIEQSNMKFLLDFRYFVDLALMYSRQLRNPEVQKLIRDGRKNHFDLIYAEFYDFNPMMAFAGLYDCPIVLVSSMDASKVFHQMVGNDVNSVTQPESIEFPFQSGQMTFWERGTSVVFDFLSLGVLMPIMKLIYRYEIKKTFATVTATPDEIEDRVVMLMSNTNPAMGFLRPSTNTLHIGFISIKPPKPLPEGDLKEFVEISEHGVIYMSLGSIVKSSELDRRIIQTFVDVFARLKYSIIWKFEDDAVTNTTANVFITKWTPQADLLAHPKMKLFITHGGMMSVQEAIDRAVPMILFPVFVDQPFNAKLMERKEVGKSLNLNSFTAELLLATIEEVLQPKYKRNIKRLREVVYDQPMTSREKVVWWLDHILRHKNLDHLKYSGRKVPLHQKYLIDIFAFTMILAAVAWGLTRFIINKKKLKIQAEKKMTIKKSL